MEDANPSSQSPPPDAQTPRVSMAILYTPAATFSCSHENIRGGKGVGMGLCVWAGGRVVGTWEEAGRALCSGDQRHLRAAVCNQTIIKPNVVYVNEVSSASQSALRI